MERDFDPERLAFGQLRDAFFRCTTRSSSTFRRAEELPQRYLEKRGQASCHI
jgi:hypothetical protein